MHAESGRGVRQSLEGLSGQGLSRDTFYRYKGAVEEGGVESLLEADRRKPKPKNRAEPDEHIFESIDHAQQTATEWLWRYNTERPNMALVGITPKQKLAQAA